MVYIPSADIIKKIQVGKLHRVYRKWGKPVEVFISKVTEHNPFSHSFHGYTYSDTEFYSNGKPIKYGMYYWMHCLTTNAVVDVECLGITDKYLLVEQVKEQK